MMNEDNRPEIKIHPLLDRLVQPPNDLELKGIQASLEASTELPVIHIWNNYHLTDQSVYIICQMKCIPFRISELDFEDLNKAALYICSVQLSKNNLSAEYRKYLIGQKFHFHVTDSETNKQTDSKYGAAILMGHELYMSAGTVIKYNTFSNAMNVVFDQNPDFAKRLLLGKTRISHENLLELSRLMPEEIKAVALSVMDDNLDHITLSYIRNEVKWSHVQKQGQITRRQRNEQKICKKAAIHQMPQYDPDAEVNSLSMTIDSWISSIQRVHNSDNFSKITNKASLQLMKKLSLLEHTVNVIQESLVERNNL